MRAASDRVLGIELASTRGRWTVAATVLGSGMGFLDTTVVNVALPAMGHELDAPLGGLQWIVTGYLVTLTSLLLLGGSLGDRYGRRRVFVVGVVWFAGASAACAAAPSLGLLVAARLLQGVGAALLVPGSLAIIEASFVQQDRGAAIGAWSGLSGVTTAIGPPLGGWFVDGPGWRWIFLINLPLAAAAVVITHRYVPESADPEPAPFDPVGAALVAVALGAATWTMIAAGERGLATSPVPAVAAVALIAAVLFVVVEHRSTHPMLPLSIFRFRQFTAANLVTVAVYAALGTSMFLLVVHLQQVLGYSALQAGLASLPITALLLVLSPPSGALAHRIGPRTQLTVGPLLIAGGMGLMAGIRAGDAYLTRVLPAVVVLGLGLAATVAPLTATVLAAVDERHAGLASGVNNAVARASQLAAVAVVPVLAGLTGEAYRRPDVFAAGFSTAMWISAGVAAAGGLVGFALVGARAGEPAARP